MTGFIDSLEALSDKEPHQSYHAIIGITTYEVLVPLKEATHFEEEVDALTEDEGQLRRLVERLHGRMRKV